MRSAKPFLVGILAIGLVAAGCKQKTASETATTEETPTVTTESARQAIQASNDAWAKGALAGDAAAIAQLYAEDGILQPPGMPRAEGRDAIQQALATMLASASFTSMELPVTDVGIAESGDLAYAVGSYKDVVATADGQSATETGKYLEVLKNVNGEWLIVADTWNSDAAPGAPAAAEGGATKGEAGQ